MKKIITVSLLVICLVVFAFFYFYFSEDTTEIVKNEGQESGSYKPFPSIAANEEYGKDFKTFDSDLFSFKYPPSSFVKVDPDNPMRLYVLTESHEGSLSAVVISVADNREGLSASEWFLGPNSGFDHSKKYFETMIDGQEAVYTNGGMWTVLNTPDNEYRISIADVEGDDGNRSFTEMGIVIESLKFKPSL